MSQNISSVERHGPGRLTMKLLEKNTVIAWNLLVVKYLRKQII
jgi:hypothetical protein